MNHFTNQSNGSHRGHSLMGRAMIRRFALFPMMLLMLLLLPAGMVAQTKASSSKYIATYNSTTQTLTFKKYTDKKLPNMSAWVRDGMIVGDMIRDIKLYNTLKLNTVKQIVFDQSFSTFTPTTLNKFFYNLTDLETIQGLEYLNTTNVTDMSYMFSSCKSIQRISAAKINTEKVTNMEGMFQYCKKLTSLDLSNFNTEKVTNMMGMFEYCYKLEAIIASDKFVTNAVTASDNMFKGCKALYGDIEFTPYKAVDKTYAKIDGGYFRDKAYDNRPWVEYADGTLTFRCGYKKTLGENEYELNSGEEKPAWWYTLRSYITQVVFDASFANARPTSCYAWFRNFTYLKQIEGIENLNTENVKDMSDMFSGCSDLTSLDVTHFNTENVTSMANMFSACQKLTELDVTHFKTANVKDMSYMFFYCLGLTSLDFTNFNTANVTDMRYMFINCSNLTTIYVSDEFVITNESYSLFFDCIKLKGATEYNKNNTDYRFANYKTGYFTKLVGKNGDEKIGAAGETLTADTLTLADDKDFVAYEPFKAKAASYSRKMSAGTTWATLCLPFEVSLQNQNFRAFQLLSSSDDVVELQEMENSIAAGTPVIIKMNEDATTLTISETDKAIEPAVAAGSSTENGKYQLVGLYQKKMFSRDADNHCYILKGGNLMNPAKILLGTSTSTVGSLPYRAYMQEKASEGGAARMFSIRLGDGTTGIKQLEADTADAADSKAEYYDLQGHRLQDLQKGVNIVKRGGKTMKVIIK